MEAGEPTPSSPTKDCGITGVSNSVWFKFKYGGQGGLPPLPNPNYSYNFDTKGSNFDTVLALYEGSSVDTLNQIECSNDNSLPNWNDNLRIPQSKLSVGKTYYVQLTGTGGARSGKYQLHYEPRGLTQPKVMTYNIGKGVEGSGLPAVAETIKALQPDIVLLNEVRDYPLGIEGPYGVSNQWEWLADQTGYPYRKYEGCTLMGGNGTNGVAILSRYPITGSTSWDLPDSDPLFDHWCILKADISIDGLNHHVFSTRFNWEGDSENRAQQEAAIDIVRSMPSTDPVIIGDFNAPWSERPYTKELWDGSGLTDAYGAAGLLFAEADPYNRKDYIYYRGSYSVYQHQERWSEQLGVPPASTHAFVFTHFLRRSITQQPDTTITSGPSGSVSATTASFAFSSSEPGSTFECSLDGAPFSACTSPKEYSSLAKGEHTFQVRAIGTGGTDPTPASRTWTVVDTASPKVSSVTPANNATGVKRNTNLTATFSEKMDALSLTKSTFQLFKVNTDGSTTQITNVTVTPSTDGLKATLNPFGTSTTLLAKSTKYKAVLTAGAKDVTGNPLDQNPTTSGNQQMVWSFQTGLQ
jgi:endonuclease/exonuclease/phosphatase family metal-dependent hydrolase